MADKGKGTPVIVVKKGGGHGGHHGGAWKVAYADFVTAMMAFFLVMWIVGQSKAVKQNVSSYFQDPVAHAAKAAAGILDGGEGVMKASGPAIVGEGQPPAEAAAKAALAKAGQEILDALTDVPGLKEVQDQIEVEITNEGLRIQLMESGLSTFFDSGSAKLSGAGVNMVSTIARVIAPLKMDVAVEGHTDSQPFDRGGYTNWELSADRANAARRVLEQHGVEPKHVVEIRGYADTRPRVPENSADPRNRRISIIVFSKLHGQVPTQAVEPKALEGKSAGTSGRVGAGQGNPEHSAHQ